MKTKLLLCMLFFGISSIVNAQAGWSNNGGTDKRNGYANIAGPTTKNIHWETSSDPLAAVRIPSCGFNNK